MTSIPDRTPLNVDTLRERLCPPAGPFARVDLVSEIGSTNDELAARAAADPQAWPDLSVLAAEYQSAGRGRLGRSWTAPRYSSLFVSILLQPAAAASGPIPMGSLGWMPLLAGLSLVESLVPFGVEAAIKWPNDVQVNDLKISGTLTQMVPGATADRPTAVLGTGVNVNLTAEELPVPSATSLTLANAEQSDRAVLLTAYLQRLAVNYREFCATAGEPTRVAPGAEAPGGIPLSERIAAAMATIGRRVRAELPGGRELVGTAVGLGADGSLTIRSDDGGDTVSVTSADVHHLRSQSPA